MLNVKRMKQSKLSLLLSIILKILAITPFKRKLSIKSQLHIGTFFIMYLIYLIKTDFGVIVSSGSDVETTTMKIIVNSLTEIVGFLLNSAIILQINIFKRHKWFILMKYLNENRSEAGKCELMMFVVFHLYFFIAFPYGLYALVYIFGLDKYFDVITVMIFTYSRVMFIWNFVSILNKIIAKYRKLDETIKAKIISSKFVLEDKPQFLRRICANLIKQRKVLSIFNEIYSATIFISLLYCSVFLLNLAEDFFSVQFDDLFLLICANLSLVIPLVVVLICVILKCDELQESGKTLFLSLCELRFLCDENKASNFDVCRENLPSFNAAGFFVVSKTTLLGICGTLATYFVVMIQFLPAQTAQEYEA